jgi:hypothetical protein
MISELCSGGMIAATPGIDVVWPGHFYRTNFRRISGQFEHPDYLAAAHRVAAAARANDKVAGFGALLGRRRLCRNELTATFGLVNKRGGGE